MWQRERGGSGLVLYGPSWWPHSSEQNRLPSTICRLQIPLPWESGLQPTKLRLEGVTIQSTAHRNSIFNFLKTLHTVFHSGCTICLSSDNTQEFQFLYILANTYFLVWGGRGGAGWGRGDCFVFSFLVANLMMMLRCDFWLAFPLKISDVENLFKCLLAICMSSLAKCQFKASVHFLNQVICWQILGCSDKWSGGSSPLPTEYSLSVLRWVSSHWAGHLHAHWLSSIFWQFVLKSSNWSPWLGLWNPSYISPASNFWELALISGELLLQIW